MSKHVYRFDEVGAVEQLCGGDWEAVRGLLGGKGAVLGDMTRLGLPVPPGYTVTTAACLAYLGGGDPDAAWQEQLTALEAVEAQTGRRFGDADNPLLLSCRSGARFSMPGMMDTVLNLGLNREHTARLAESRMRPRLAWNLYRRLLQMFGEVVLGLEAEPFEELIAEQRQAAGASGDADLDGDSWQALADRFEALIEERSGSPFPADPHAQLRAATRAVFDSWNGPRAVAYREAAGIAHDLGTAVNVQMMVFGNLDEHSATGVFMSRNATTGEPELEGDYLPMAQGEDVVAGIRPTRPLTELEAAMPGLHAELRDVARRLERHYRDMQDMEFTIESGKLWVLQSRSGKRTAAAAVRIATDLVDEGLIEPAEAVGRIEPAHVDFFLHPQFDPAALAGHEPIAAGLNVSPGAAVGIVAMDADRAVELAAEGHDVVLARNETKPDDVHGLLAARGVLTHRGGRTSHAALVARQFGKPAVVGVESVQLDYDERCLRFDDGTVVAEGEWLSLDGTAGRIYAEPIETLTPDLDDPHLLRVLGWADEIRTLGVRANADYPDDAERARALGAEGIGLCRTEHMFFAAERLPIVQRMILAEDPEQRALAIAELHPMQRGDFDGLLRAMDGLPVIVRLLDPPLHEFLPSRHEVAEELGRLRDRLADAEPDAHGALKARIAERQAVAARVAQLEESNPMLGTRGVRLGILMPELYQMQVRALFEAAAQCAADGLAPRPEVMIPLVAHAGEIDALLGSLREVVVEVEAASGVSLPHHFGTMIELPRAALTAREIAARAEFFSFGTNDLTQTVFGISRDDAEAGFLTKYLETGVLRDNPFVSIDRAGVGRLMALAVADGRAARPELETGICGEHGGDPASIAFCHELGLDYVSCSPGRVPIARLAAAHAALAATDATER